MTADDRRGQGPPSSSRPASRVPDRGNLTGAMIEGFFGTAWAAWGASGFAGGVSDSIRVVGIVVGVVIVARSVRLRRSAPARSRSIYGSRAFRFVVVLEVAGLVLGAVVLGAMGDSEYAPAWCAAVVGAHFLAFGRLFHPRFHWLGTALLVGGIVGALVGLGGGGRAGIAATSGLIAATSLFAVGGLSVFAPTGPEAAGSLPQR